ncbi:hypothetical protein [Cyclonatronum proteinivorum]|uniref:hypothetical protein n=1 Tax=Cyclonatronum proteinivorum TaxID=1457365 RepID=UPI000F538180|nr:hypothetical protein [Cyclonatronum proteinivorum]
MNTLPNEAPETSPALFIIKPDLLAKYKFKFSLAKMTSNPGLGIAKDCAPSGAIPAKLNFPADEVEAKNTCSGYFCTHRLDFRFAFPTRKFLGE